MSVEEKNALAVEIAVKFGGTDGAHHKDWVIDQMVRALLSEEEYEKLVSDIRDRGYDWEVGIPP